MERLQQKKEDQEVAKYGDNNFWRISEEPAYDVDELLQELEEDGQSSSSQGEQAKDEAPEEAVTDKDKNTDNTDNTQNS